MAKSKRKLILKILSESKAPESVKKSFLKAYSAAHRNKRRSSDLGGGA